MPWSNTNVNSLINWIPLALSQSGFFEVDNLDAYNAVVLDINWDDNAPNSTHYGYITVQSLNSTGNTIDHETFYVSGSYWNEPSQSLVGGGEAKLVFPLNGAVGIAVTPVLNTLSTLTVTMHGTNLSLPFSFNTILPQFDNVLLSVSSHNLLTTGNSQFPLPTGSSPIQIWGHLGASAAATSVNMRVIDATDNVQLNIFAIGKGQDVNNGMATPWLNYISNLRPLMLQFDTVTGTNPITLYAVRQSQL